LKEEGVWLGQIRSCFESRDLRELAYLISKPGRPDYSSHVYDLEENGGPHALEAVRKKIQKHRRLRRLVQNPRTASTHDFYVLSSRKRVNVSPTGNRASSVKALAMAVRDGVAHRAIGSITWRKTDEMPSPKWRVMTLTRSDPLRRVKGGTITWRTLKDEKNQVSVELVLSPPLLSGECIEYGFYIWNRGHFAMTRSKAESRYGDEWVREGVVVRDPIDRLGIEVNLPQGFVAQEAHIETNPILHEGGPNAPGEVTEMVHQQGRTLKASLHSPEDGRYFLSWIPPERWRSH